MHSTTEDRGSAQPEMRSLYTRFCPFIDALCWQRLSIILVTASAMAQSCAHLCATPATLEIVAAMLTVHGACTAL